MFVVNFRCFSQSKHAGTDRVKNRDRRRAVEEQEINLAKHAS